MPDFLKGVVSTAAAQHPLLVLLNLVLATLAGAAVAWIYHHTRPRSQASPSFSATIVLLAALISMVTGVVGSDIARAFSLVGALSIVRFRTVVRDTQDTAFVIFAVVVGMAVGAHQYIMGAAGLVVVGAGAAVLGLRQRAPGSQEPFQISVRVGLGHDLDVLLNPTLDKYVHDKRLVAISTAKQGMMLDISYEAQLKNHDDADELVAALNKLEGVQSVELNRRTVEEES